jgi:hypothetical protein
MASHDGQVFVTLFNLKGETAWSWLVGHQALSFRNMIETAVKGSREFLIERPADREGARENETREEIAGE